MYGANSVYGVNKPTLLATPYFTFGSSSVFLSLINSRLTEELTEDELKI
jgi:hypothetical protein